MKKNILIIIAFVFSISAFSQSFDSSKFRAGGGLVYATDIGNIGLTFNGVYSITPEWAGAFAYSHIFEKDYVSFNIFDFDAHYVFHQADEKMNFYGIAGIAITSAKVDIPTIDMGEFGSVGGGSASDSSTGFNMGVGMNYLLSDKLNLAPEARFTVMDGSYFRIGASIQYMF